MEAKKLFDNVKDEDNFKTPLVNVKKFAATVKFVELNSTIPFVAKGEPVFAIAIALNEFVAPVPLTV